MIEFFAEHYSHICIVVLIGVGFFGMVGKRNLVNARGVAASSGFSGGGSAGAFFLRRKPNSPSRSDSTPKSVTNAKMKSRVNGM